MRSVRVFAVVLLAVLAAAALPSRPAAAVDAPPLPALRGCMDRVEQRGTVLQGQAIRLGFALRAVKAQDGDALLRARLCYAGNGLVYVLTLLSRTGTVTNVLVDARTGTVLKAR